MRLAVRGAAVQAQVAADHVGARHMNIAVGTAGHGLRLGRLLGGRAWRRLDGLLPPRAP